MPCCSPWSRSFLEFSTALDWCCRESLTSSNTSQALQICKYIYNSGFCKRKTAKIIVIPHSVSTDRCHFSDLCHQILSIIQMVNAVIEGSQTSGHWVIHSHVACPPTAAVNHDDYSPALLLLIVLSWQLIRRFPTIKINEINCFFLLCCYERKWDVLCSWQVSDEDCSPLVPLCCLPVIWLYYSKFLFFWDGSNGVMVFLGFFFHLFSSSSCRQELPYSFSCSHAFFQDSSMKIVKILRFTAQTLKTFVLSDYDRASFKGGLLPFCQGC